MGLKKIMDSVWFKNVYTIIRMGTVGSNRSNKSWLLFGQNHESILNPWSSLSPRIRKRVQKMSSRAIVVAGLLEQLGDNKTETQFCPAYVEMFSDPFTSRWHLILSSSSRVVVLYQIVLYTYQMYVCITFFFWWKLFKCIPRDSMVKLWTIIPTIHFLHRSSIHHLRMPIWCNPIQRIQI